MGYSPKGHIESDMTELLSMHTYIYIYTHTYIHPCTYVYIVMYTYTWMFARYFHTIAWYIYLICSHNQEIFLNGYEKNTVL